ncbi:MAG: hypothetical protein HRU69_05005 [Flammeovirgaceae bacterium]|nr:MAG: hypothetical protein HRU69_05005 [Flammeovirgaceae bacterium]
MPPHSAGTEAVMVAVPVTPGSTVTVNGLPVPLAGVTSVPGPAVQLTTAQRHIHGCKSYRAGTAHLVRPDDAERQVGGVVADQKSIYTGGGKGGEVAAGGEIARALKVAAQHQLSGHQPGAIYFV